MSVTYNQPLSKENVAFGTRRELLFSFPTSQNSGKRKHSQGVVMRNGSAQSQAELTALPTWRPGASTRPQMEGRMSSVTPLTSPSLSKEPGISIQPVLVPPTGGFLADLSPLLKILNGALENPLKAIGNIPLHQKRENASESG